jgi:hypothetical protein
VRQYSPRVGLGRSAQLGSDAYEIFEPIVLGKRCFWLLIPISSWLDTDTGRERWRFYADGPVRFARWRRTNSFASDDGYLYCLKAADGSLVWKFRGGPDANLGNERLISMWPARAVVSARRKHDYFAASIYSFMGTFRTRWTPKQARDGSTTVRARNTSTSHTIIPRSPEWHHKGHWRWPATN